MNVRTSKIEEAAKKKQSLWGNSAFCFRFSILTIVVWFMISSIISLMIYFFQLYGNKGDLDELIFDFSTWLFVLPSLASFGMINALPIIIPWLMNPIEEELDKNPPHSSKPPKENSYSKSYKNMTAKLEKNSD